MFDTARIESGLPDKGIPHETQHHHYRYRTVHGSRSFRAGEEARRKKRIEMT